MSRGAAKMEDAADLYVRAANTYKVAKKWKGIVCTMGVLYKWMKIW